MRKISIDPITRLEGHGKIEIFLNDGGEVENAYLQVPEFRGFERFCEGRPATELSRITSRICGVCPWAHHMAATKCLDDLYKVEVPSTAKKLREMAYSIYSFYDKTLNFYFLAAPDFVVGPGAPAAERNIIGVINTVGVDIGKKVISIYKDAQELMERIGGRTIHPVFGLPGGVSKGISESDRKEIIERCKTYIDFANFTIETFHKIVLGNQQYVDVIVGDVYQMESYYMGMVDENNKVNFYDGDIRVVTPDGDEFAKFHPRDYQEHIEEHVVPWTYLKFPFLKKIGWKGIVDGKDSGLYRCAPLGRLNASDGMATPLAQKEFERMYDTLGGKPAHHTLAFHWARLVELLYSAERALELAQDPEITGDDYHNIPTKTPEMGVGIVEAPRGTLIHQYWTDEKGVTKKINMIVASGNNYGGMSYSIKRAAQKLVNGDNIDPTVLNMVEMAFRAYDPCLACATHHLPGQTPLELNFYNSSNELIHTLKSANLKD